MKRTMILAMALSIVFCLSACDGNYSHIENNIITESSTEFQETTKAGEEEHFLELFANCYSTYKREGLGARLEYAELEDIYQENPDNKVMENLYYFCTTCSYYWLADLMDDESYISSAKSEAAKIDPAYDGPYSEEVIAFAIDLLGDDYAALAKVATTQQANYEALTMQDKVEILERIENNTDTDVDILWEQIAQEYGISINHVTKINTDIEVITAWGNSNKEASKQESEKIDYDAVLEYGSGTVVIADSRDDLDDFMRKLANDDSDSIGKMVTDGKIAYVDKGTKVDVIEKKLTVAKIRILEGPYKNVECWTIIEAVKEK